MTISAEPMQALQKALDPLDISILRDLANGAKLEVIAQTRHLSERSVRRRIRRVCGVYHVDTSIEAVVQAVRHGLI